MKIKILEDVTDFIGAEMPVVLRAGDVVEVRGETASFYEVTATAGPMVGASTYLFKDPHGMDYDKFQVLPGEASWTTSDPQVIASRHKYRMWRFFHRQQILEGLALVDHNPSHLTAKYKAALQVKLRRLAGHVKKGA
jgi:hypothetical protein